MQKVITICKNEFGEYEVRFSDNPDATYYTDSFLDARETAIDSQNRYGYQIRKNIQRVHK